MAKDRYKNRKSLHVFIHPECWDIIQEIKESRREKGDVVTNGKILEEMIRAYKESHE